MKKYCKFCEKPFESNHLKQKFCSRKCFKLNYINKLKEEKPPIFSCSNCGDSIKLTFNPKKEKQAWKEFVCPNCGVGKNNEEK